MRTSTQLDPSGILNEDGITSPDSHGGETG